MKRLRDSSISAKLSLVGMLTAGTALFLACALFVMNDVSATKRTMVEHLNTLADVLGGNCVAALTFNDPKAAKEILASLRFEPSIRVACVFDRQGRLFAVYRAPNLDGSVPPVDSAAPAGYVFHPEGNLEIAAPIYDNNEQIGKTVLVAGMSQLDARFRRQMLTALGVLVVTLILSFLLSTRLQKLVSVPITNLARTAERISQSRDFSIRMQKLADDEIGSLYTAFNRMLERIGESERDLKQSRDELERRVQERTRQLSQANDVLSHEIVERRRTEEELRQLQSQHLDAARRAGMAEIATSVLHNVGNVLNSVNVSAALIAEKLRRSGIDDLRIAADLLNRHLDDPGAFVSSDARGRNLPRFLIQLSRKMCSDEEQILEEIRSLSKNIEHIKGIVSLQQSYAGVSGITEEFSLPALIEDALSINAQSMVRHDIEIVREFEEIPVVRIEKQKLLQILVNLFANAQHSVVAAGRPAPRITIRLKRAGSDCVRLEVADNGVGIPPENLTRIFSHGFTTRKDGHGFGLHSAANLVRELGGSLAVESRGAGLGATFALELPFAGARLRAALDTIE